MCIMLARAVFYWAGTGCFQEFIRRLARKDLKTAFEEVGAATYFSLHGWGVYARPESGTKQEDFDFQITNGNHKLNVEVAALQSEENTDKVVLNKLGKKRKQLPAGQPAIIYCVLPSECWGGFGHVGLGEKLSGLSEKFFRNTSRVNAIIFALEIWVDRPPHGSIDVTIQRRQDLAYIFENASPKHRIDLSSFNRAPIMAHQRSELDKWFETLL
jgi:hypothetical protein